MFRNNLLATLFLPRYRGMHLRFEHHFDFFLLLKNDIEILVFPVKEHLFTP